MKNDRFWRKAEYSSGNFFKLRALLMQPVLDEELDHILSVPLLLVVHQPTEHSEFFTSYLISLYTRKKWLIEGNDDTLSIILLFVFFASIPSRLVDKYGMLVFFISRFSSCFLSCSLFYV